jgi:hypothetical protein
VTIRVVARLEARAIGSAGGSLWVATAHAEVVRLAVPEDFPPLEALGRIEVMVGPGGDPLGWLSPEANVGVVRSTIPSRGEPYSRHRCETCGVLWAIDPVALVYELTCAKCGTTSSVDEPDGGC